jgi:4-hydroxy-tetrahydrodipicolinate reductase
MTRMIKVGVIGCRGRMGVEVVRAVEAAEDLALVAAVDAGDDYGPLTDADVVVEFTVPSATMANVRWCVDHGLDVVVGTTGFDSDRLATVQGWVADGRSRVLIASNFSIGSILMMRFAELAAPYFESVEIVELHHPDKVDAPSGTAATTARRIAAARAAAGVAPSPDATETDPLGARGATIEGVHVHSVRQRGLFANQEVRLGNEGEQLVITENGFARSAYMPGVLAAVRGIKDLPPFTFGIEGILGL